MRSGRAMRERYAGRGQKARPDPTLPYYDDEDKVCICPAGEFLYQNGSQVVIQGREAVKFTGANRVCGPCRLRDQCLRHPQRTPVRQVVFFTGKTYRPETHTDRMKRKLDSEAGRRLYGRRLGTVEPVFANIRYNKGLDRFTLRGRHKVDTQWKLYCMVHNIEKLAHHGYAQ